MSKKTIIIAVMSIVTIFCNAQISSPNYQNRRWRDVALNMPSDWYKSDEAKLVAENVLLAQKEIGGWEKNRDFHKKFSDLERSYYLNNKSEIGATFDNNATTTELRFLAKVYAHNRDERYKEAFLKGLNYIFIAQYENGGWPQFYPVRKGSVDYSAHITYNDDAMVNTMNFLKEIILDNKEFAALQISNEIKEKAKIAFDKGVQAILDTQIIVDGKPTVWCAQHDEITLAPAKARSYELASFSGAESVNIVLLLMEIDNPSKEIVASIKGAVQWFENNKIEGIRIENTINKDGKRDRVVVEDKNAPAIWGRFYDLETSQPFFCSRDGVKRNTLAEISYERRNAYSWYTDKPAELLHKYPEWLKKNKL